MSPFKRIRTQLGITQGKLAAEIGVSQGAIANYESGIRTPKLRHAQAFRAFSKKHGVDISLEEILTWEPSAV